MLQMKEVATILRKCGFASSREYVQNNIPINKLNNARITMLIPPNEMVVGLYDDTLFGSGKDGLCFGCFGLYYRVYLGQPGFISYEELAQMKTIVDTKSIELMGPIGSIVIKFSSVTKSYKVIEVLRDYMVQLVQRSELNATQINVQSIKNTICTGNYLQANDEITQLKKYYDLFESEEKLEIERLETLIQTELNKIERIQKMDSLPFNLTTMQNDLEAGNHRSVQRQLAEYEKYLELLSIEKKLTYYKIEVENLLALEQEEKCIKVIHDLKRNSNFSEETIYEFETIEQKAQDQIHQKKLVCYNRLKTILNQRKSLLDEFDNVYQQVDDLLSTEQFEEAYYLLNHINQELLEEIPKDYTEMFKLRRILCLVGLERVATAKTEFEIYSEEYKKNRQAKSSLYEKIVAKEQQLQERSEVAIRERFTEGLKSVAMFDRFGHYESAYDTLGYLESSLPEKMYRERSICVTYKLEALLGIFQYDKAIELYEEQPPEITELLADDWMKQISSHQEKYQEECIQSCLEKANRCLKYNYLDKAERLVQQANTIKKTFAGSCCELYIEILRVHYQKVDELYAILLDDIQTGVFEGEVSCEAIEDEMEAVKSSVIEMKNAIVHVIRDSIAEDDRSAFDKDEYSEFIDPYGSSFGMLCSIYGNHEMVMDFYQDMEDELLDYQGFVPMMVAALKHSSKGYCNIVEDAFDIMLDEIEVDANEKAPILFTGSLKELQREMGCLVDRIDDLNVDGEFKEGDECDELMERLIKLTCQISYQKVRNLFCCIFNDELRNQLALSNRIPEQCIQPEGLLRDEYLLTKENCKHYFDLAKSMIHLKIYDRANECFEIETSFAKGSLMVPMEVVAEFKQTYREIEPTIEYQIVANNMEGIQIIYVVSYEFNEQVYQGQLVQTINYQDTSKLEEQIEKMLYDYEEEHISSEDDVYEDEDDFEDDDESGYEDPSESYDDDVQYEDDDSEYEVQSDRENSVSKSVVESKRVSGAKQANSNSTDQSDLEALKQELSSMSYVERAEIRNSITELGLKPIEQVKLRVFISRLEQEELSELCKNIEILDQSGLSNLKKTIYSRCYSDVVIEEWIQMIDDFIE